MYNDFSMPLFWQKYWPRTVILHIYCNTAPWRVDLPVLVLVEQLSCFTLPEIYDPQDH